MTRQDSITQVTGPFNEDLEMIRNQLRRFIEAEVTAKAEPWEEQGKVPRDVLRRMGDLGVLGMRYDEQYGGAGLDVMSSVVLAEEVGRSTFGGFSATVLVHTDMASPHLENAGTPEQKARVEKIKEMTPAKIAPLCVALADPTCDTTGQIFCVRNNEIFLMGQSRPERGIHRSEGWTVETVLDHAIPAMKSSFYPLERSPDVFNWDPV